MIQKYDTLTDVVKLSSGLNWLRTYILNLLRIRLENTPEPFDTQLPAIEYGSLEMLPNVAQYVSRFKERTKATLENLVHEGMSQLVEENHQDDRLQEYKGTFVEWILADS